MEGRISIPGQCDLRQFCQSDLLPEQRLEQAEVMRIAICPGKVVQILHHCCQLRSLRLQRQLDLVLGFSALHGSDLLRIVTIFSDAIEELHHAADIRRRDRIIDVLVRQCIEYRHDSLCLLFIRQLRNLFGITGVYLLNDLQEPCDPFHLPHVQLVHLAAVALDHWLAVHIQNSRDGGVILLIL